MIVKATEIKNNFGKYLKLLDREDIIVTKSGSPVARITRQDDWGDTGIVCEQAAAYNYNGRKMTYEEFMEMYENTDERYEYINGEVFLMTSPRITHQQIIGNLYMLFRIWFQGKKCTPYLSPFDVTLKKGENNMNVVQPDILVICDPENRSGKDRYTGIPSLVVEVLSDSTTRMDLVRKLDLYMQTGVREYWIINHFNKEVIIYLFQDNNISEMKLFVKDDAVKSLIFEGLTMDLKEIFA